MGKIDYHLHTEDSYDSRIKAIELAAKAIERGYDEIAITEHLDLLPQEVSVFGLPSLSRYRKRISNLQTTFPKLRILFGIEVGDYHLVRNYAKPLLDMFSFDIVLGSVHFLSDHSNVAIPLSRPLAFAQRENYYKHNLSLVSNCDIDVLAHLGVYKRYYTDLVDEKEFYPLIRDIYSVMIARNIALEINFSSLRKSYPSIIPETELVDMYLAQGGELITIGSDAHHLDHFDDHYTKIPEYIRNIAETKKVFDRIRKNFTFGNIENIKKDKGEQPCQE